MDENFIRAGVLQRNLRVLNQKEDRHLQQKLKMLEKQQRYTHKMLQQRRESLLKEHRKVMIIKVCEPKATVNIAMKEIEEHQKAAGHFSTIQTTEGRGFYSSKSQYRSEGLELVEQSRSISAKTLLVKPARSVRRRGYIQGSLSLMQMKNIATIDSISEKELARQQREAREEMERLHQFTKETLQKKATAFIERLRDKSTTYTEPP